MMDGIELKDATDFLGAEKLGLTQDQYCGLVKTLALLEAGVLDRSNDFTHGFDMEHWGGECGTVCCLGGTAEVLGACKMGNYEFTTAPGRERRPELTKLFYPGGLTNREGFCHRAVPHHPGWEASTKEAAQVLRYYLKTGLADWDLPYRDK